MTLITASLLIAMTPILICLLIVVVAGLLGYVVGHTQGEATGYRKGAHDEHCDNTARTIRIKRYSFNEGRAYEREFSEAEQISQSQEVGPMTTRRVTPGIPPSAAPATQGATLSQR